MAKKTKNPKKKQSLNSNLASPATNWWRSKSGGFTTTTTSTSSSTITITITTTTTTTITTTTTAIIIMIIVVVVVVVSLQMHPAMLLHKTKLVYKSIRQVMLVSVACNRYCK